MLKRIGYLFTGTIIAMVFLGSVTVNAEELPTSEAEVKFVEDTEANDILDPTDPNEPYEPEEGDDGKTDKHGPLSIDYVPKLDFGEQTISLKDKIYHTKNVKPFIQVTDKRAEAHGWQVNVSASPFTSDNNNPLNGATIHFKNSEVVTIKEYKKYGYPVATKSFTLSANNDSEMVVFAEVGEGRGSWITRWFPPNYDRENPPETNSSVTLMIPGGVAKEGTYTSTLTWTLENTPQAPEVEE